MTSSGTVQAGGLDALFAPSAIAVVGASADTGKVGGRTLELLLERRFEGAVYPISRRGGTIFGWQTSSAIGEVGRPIDLAVLCVGEDAAVAAVRECADVGVRAVVLYATFAGEKGQQQLDEIKSIAAGTGMRVLGPNTLGSRGIVQNGVFATFSHDVEAGVLPGSAAIVAQSGGLGAYFGSSYLSRVGVGSRYVVDTGGELDITLAELIGHLSQDPEVSVIGAIVEGVTDGPGLVRAIGDSVARGVPVVVYKTGRTAASASGIQSHTGAIAGDARLFESAARDAGAAIAEDERDFVDALFLLDRGIAPRGRRLGIVTPSGGFGIVAVDAADKEGLVLPEPASPPVGDEVDQLASGHLVNPYDTTSRAGANPDVIKYAARWMSRQGIDALVIWQAHLLFMEVYRTRLLEAIAAVRQECDVPIIVCGIAPDGFDDQLAHYGAVRMEEPTRMIRAIGIVAPPPPPASLSRGQQVDAVHHEASSESPTVGSAARAALSFLPHVESVSVSSASDAVKVAEERSWAEVILKVESDRAPHKTELGLVVGPVGVSALPDAFARIAASRVAAGVEDEDIVAQPRLRGVEIALGAYRDPMMGPSVLVALGGIHIEIFKDFVSAVAPITKAKALTMIDSLRSHSLLYGARGAKPSDVDALADALVGLSEYAVANKDWSAIDINPVFVAAKGEGLAAADALIVWSAP